MAESEKERERRDEAELSKNWGPRDRVDHFADWAKM